MDENWQPFNCSWWLFRPINKPITIQVKVEVVDVIAKHTSMHGIIKRKLAFCLCGKTRLARVAQRNESAMWSHKLCIYFIFFEL